jgi:hypothetical protein
MCHYEIGGETSLIERIYDVQQHFNAPPNTLQAAKLKWHEKGISQPYDSGTVAQILLCEIPQRGFVDDQLQSVKQQYG